MGFGQKNFYEIYLFHFMSFFCLDFCIHLAMADRPSNIHGLPRRWGRLKIDGLFPILLFLQPSQPLDIGVLPIQWLHLVVYLLLLWLTTTFFLTPHPWPSTLRRRRRWGRLRIDVVCPPPSILVCSMHRQLQPQPRVVHGRRHLAEEVGESELLVLFK